MSFMVAPPVGDLSCGLDQLSRLWFWLRPYWLVACSQYSIQSVRGFVMNTSIGNTLYFVAIHSGNHGTDIEVPYFVSPLQCNVSSFFWQGHSILHLPGYIRRWPGDGTLVSRYTNPDGVWRKRPGCGQSQCPLLFLLHPHPHHHWLLEL